MARKKLSSKLPIEDKTLDQVLDAVRDLFNIHSAEMGEAIEESDTRCLTVGVAIELDCSESAPTIDVKLRFSTSVTDRRTLRCDDPRQGVFETLTPEQLKKERDKEKAEAAAEAEAAEDGGKKGRKKKGGTDSEAAARN